MLEEIQLKKKVSVNQKQKKANLKIQIRETKKRESVRNSLVLAIIIVLKPCSL